MAKEKMIEGQAKQRLNGKNDRRTGKTKAK